MSNKQLYRFIIDTGASKAKRLLGCPSATAVSVLSYAFNYKQNPKFNQNVFKYHIQASGSVTKLIQKSIDAGDNGKDLVPDFVSTTNEGINSLDGLSQDQLKDTTYTINCSDKYNHNSSSTTVLECDSEKQAKDLVTDIRSGKFYFVDGFPGKLVRIWSQNSAKEYLALPDNQKKKYKEDNADKLDFEHKSALTDGDPLTGKYFELDGNLVGIGEHVITHEPDGTIHQIIVPITTGEHSLAGLAAWIQSYSPKFKNCFISTSIHVGSNRVPFVDKINNIVAPRIKTLMAHMLLERFKFGLDQNHEKFMEHLRDNNPKLHKSFMILSVAQGMGTVPLKYAQKRLGFNIDVEYKTIYLPLNDADVKKFETTSYEDLGKDAPANKNPEAEATVDNAPVEAKDIVSVLTTELFPSEITAQQEKEVREFMKESFQLGLYSGITKLNQELEPYLKVEGEKGVDHEMVMSSDFVSKKVTDFIQSLYLDKKNQIIQDAPDWVTALTENMRDQVLDTVVKADVVWPVIQPTGVVDTIYAVEETKAHYEASLKEQTKTNTDLADLQQKIEDTKTSIENQKYQAEKEHRELTIKEKEKIAADEKDLAEKKDKLKEIEDQKKNVDKKVEGQEKDHHAAEKDKQKILEGKVK